MTELFEYTEVADGLPSEIETVVKQGDIWQLGEHYLMCGDCTKLKNVEKLLNSKKVDMVFTDPPYGISIVRKNGKIGGGKSFGTCGGGGNVVKASIYKSFEGDDTTNTAELFYEIIKDYEKIILFGGNYFIDFLPKKNWIVWDKLNTGNYADGEMAWTNIKTNLKIYRYLWNGMIRCEKEQRVHPCQKPVSLLENIIKDFSKENEIIFDGFLGSGSTLIACEKTRRVCYGLEIEPYYCDVIISRYKKFSNKEIKKIN